MDLQEDKLADGSVQATIGNVKVEVLTTVLAIVIYIGSSSRKYLNIYGVCGVLELIYPGCAERRRNGFSPTSNVEPITIENYGLLFYRFYLQL